MLVSLSSSGWSLCSLLTSSWVCFCCQGYSLSTCSWNGMVLLVSFSSFSCWSVMLSLSCLWWWCWSLSLSFSFWSLTSYSLLTLMSSKVIRYSILTLIFLTHFVSKIRGFQSFFNQGISVEILHKMSQSEPPLQDSLIYFFNINPRI